MVDRRIRYLNPNGKIPPPGGGAEFLEELTRPALSDLHSELLPTVRAAAAEEAPPLDPVRSAPVINGKKASPVATPTPVACAADKKQQSDPQEEASCSEDYGRKGIANHSGGVVLTFERVEALQPVRADSREKTVNALRQLLESVSSGDMPWELLQADYDGQVDLGERSRFSRRLGGSREGLRRGRHTDQAGQFAEFVVPLGEGIARGRTLVVCPGWFLLMLLLFAATCLALIAEQGLRNAGLFTHFLDSKGWKIVKLALIFSAALAALRGLFFSLFTNPHTNTQTKAF
jgi:hypothetical protein